MALKAPISRAAGARNKCSTCCWEGVPFPLSGTLRKREREYARFADAHAHARISCSPAQLVLGADDE